MSGDPKDGARGAEQAWIWDEGAQGWEKNPAYIASGTPLPSPQQQKKWPWIVGLVLLLVIGGAIIGNSESFQDGYRDARGSEDTSTGAVTATSVAPSPRATSSASLPPAGDGSVRAALEQAGVGPDMVAALAVVGDETGYGVSKSTPMDEEQREGFAYAIVLLCRDIAAGETTWEQSVNADVFSGAELTDAQRLNDHARTEFCPRVRAETPTAALANAAVSPGSPQIALIADVAVHSRTVTVSGGVPLPDGAKLSIALTRIEYFGFDDEKHYAESGFSTAVVADGRFDAVLSDDQSKARGFVDAYNAGEPPERQIRVSDLVAVRVVFDPRDDQPAAVVSAVGGDDAPVLASSPQGNEFGSLTADPYWRLELESEHQLPFGF